MSNLSRLRRRSSRSARQAARSIRYTSNGAERISKPIKPQKTFMEYALSDGDLMVIMDTVDILKDHLNRSATIIKLELFPDMRIIADKIILIYSKRKKMYMYIAVNDKSTTCSILYKSQDVKQLPNIWSINLDPSNTNLHINENGNRLMNSIFDIIADLTSNPVHFYKTSELFSK